MEIEIKLLEKDWQCPVYQHPGEDAGLDLQSRVDCLINPGEFLPVPTGIAIAIPRGYVGYVNPRSGLANRYGVTVLNADGVIDSGFRGEICVILINHGKKPFSIRKGDRIAQLIIHQYEQIEWKQVAELEESERKEKGFGQTGK